MLAGTIVVGVKAVHPVQFLAVVLVRLEVGIGRGRSVRIRCAEGIVVRRLLHLAACIHDLTDVSEVVPVVVVEREHVGCRTRNRCLGVAALEEIFVNPAVLHHRKGTNILRYHKLFAHELSQLNICILVTTQQTEESKTVPLVSSFPVPKIVTLISLFYHSLITYLSNSS